MKKNIILKIIFFISATVFAQTVTIDIEEQRFLGDVSELDRSKFFNIHDNKSDEVSRQFLIDNNVGFGREFWGPFASNGKGNFPSTPPTQDGIVRDVRRTIFTVNPKNVWQPGYDPIVAGVTAARYFVDQVGTVPEYWEPFNEPFIKASSTEYTSLGYTTSQVITEMSVWFKEMAKKIHDTPELAKMKVIGFSDAYPSFERRGFTNWRDRQKKFIDIAGLEMDALSVHPYDGVNVIGQANGRSGSNSEAILDLLESYTALKFGTPKKLAISEFGVIEDSSLYTDPFDNSQIALTIRAFNSMFFNFFERQDNLEITIPFITGRADWFYNNDNKIPKTPYIPSFVMPTELRTTRNPEAPYLYRNNTMVLSWKKNFYKFWKNVEGDRASIKSDDLDVQAQIFVKGKKAYLILNNLDESEKNVSLSFLTGANNVANIVTKSLIINGTNQPIYNDGVSSNSLPNSLSLKNGETKLLEITYHNNISFTKTITRNKYYGKTNEVSLSAEFAPILKINQNKDHVYTFSNVDKGAINQGNAVLRVSVGVPLKVEFGANQGISEGLDIIPTEVKVNGTSIALPTNWKGYDQANRIEFFGLLEFNVPYNLLKSGTNSVSIKYAKTEGVSTVAIGNNRYEKSNVTIASVILSVEKKTSDVCDPVKWYADIDHDGLGDANNFVLNCSPVKNYVLNADDDCPNDFENTCNDIVSSTRFVRPLKEKVANTAASFTVNLDYTTTSETQQVLIELRKPGAGYYRGAGVFPNAIETKKNVPLTITIPEQDRPLANGTYPLLTFLRTPLDGGGFSYSSGETVSIEVVNPSVLGIEKFEATTGFRLKSNPVNTLLYFTTNKAEGEVYKIYEINGREVARGKYKSNIDVSKLTSGLYLIEIKNAVTKFIKK